MRWVKNNRILSLLLVLAMAYAIYYFISAIKFIPYSYSVDYGEGYVMNFAGLWANGQWKWDILSPPYITMPYGLGYATILYPFVKTFGAELWVGRLVSFVSALVTCGLLYLLVKEITGRKIYGLLAALLPATQPIFRDWSIMARVDMTAVMFDMLGFYLVYKYRNNRWLYIAVVPFVCAVMVKLSAITGLVAVLIYFAFYNRRKGVLLAGLFAIVLAAVVIPIEIATKGGFLLHLVKYQNTNGLSYLPRVTYMFNMFAFPLMIFLVLALMYFRRNMKTKYTMMGLLLPVAVVTNSLETLRPGSASMYYMEAVIAVILCAVLGLHALLKRKKDWQMETAFILIILSVVSIVYMPRHNADQPNAQFAEDVKAVETLMIDTDKPIITENSAIVLDMGKPIYIENFIFTNLTRLGYWNEASYIENYNNKDFEYILLRTQLEKKLPDDGLFSVAAQEAIAQNYHLSWQTESQEFPYSMYLYEANEG